MSSLEIREHSTKAETLPDPRSAHGFVRHVCPACLSGLFVRPRDQLGATAGNDPEARRFVRTLTHVSRIFWIGVGAAGGIVAYRKANETLTGVRERSLRENLTKVARTASNVAASARYLAALSADDQPPAGVVDIRQAPAARR